MAKQKPEEVNPTVPSNPYEMPPVSSEPVAPVEVGPTQPEPQKVYTIDEVRSMMAEFVAKVNKVSGISEEKELPDPNRHTARLSRLEAKFVVDFEDKNDDVYTNKVIHAFNKWDERERQWIAWISLVFQDGSTKEVPLKYFVESAVGIECDIIKKEEKDTSYSIGTVERQVIKSYHPEGTGVKVDQRVTSKKTVYTLRTPKSTVFPEGEILTVPEYVINIAGAPTIRK